MRSPFFSDPRGTIAPPRPSLTLYFCLVGAFILALLPHVPQFPLWISVLVLAAVVLRSVGEVRRWPLPSSTTCGLLALCLLAGIYRQFDTVFGRDAGTAFMAGLLALKFFELRGPRDVALIIFSTFFVVMSSLLYSQALELFIYCLIMMWVLTALLLRSGMGDRPDNRLLYVLRGAGLIFLQALPLTLFFFFFFPRYHGTLQLGVDDTSVGLTDKVEPGSISRLADDDSTAMTVRFTGLTLPDASTAYWRALVLWSYDRGAWTIGPGGMVPANDAGLGRGERGDVFEQEITVRAHFHRWLFALDYPVTLAEPVDGSGSAPWSQAEEGGVLQLTSPAGLLREERYRVSSAPTLAPEELSDALRTAALELPGDPHDQIDPRVRALATRLEENAPDAETYILAVLHYFRHGGFVYSVTPGGGGRDPLAHFLFETKSGFCEHYASAFAVLMRLGGYPARLVVGYQGAQFNPYKNIYVVKQSDAHCWDEVWVEKEKRWRRVDPTTVLSHVESRLAGASSANDPAANESLSIEVAHHRLTLVSSSHLPSWLRRGMLELQWRQEEVEADWDDWVFSYDPQTQSRLAQALGFHGEAVGFFALISLAAVILAAFVLAFTMGRRRPLSPVESLYARFCRRLAKKGLPRDAWEGPLAYTQRAAAAFPERRDPIRDLGQIVARTRYAPHPSTPSRHELKELQKNVELRT
jgi:transglutaminase-like putative cysteine protease